MSIQRYKLIGQHHASGHLGCPVPSVTIDAFKSDDGDFVKYSDAEQRISALESERDQAVARAEGAEAECAEQARLNGMGSEREAKLMGRLATAVGLLKQANDNGRHSEACLDRIYRGEKRCTCGVNEYLDAVTAFLAAHQRDGGKA